MDIELSQEERDLLAGLLEKELEDARSELHHTQAHDYKESLKARERVVRALLAKLTG